jgi:hypothetical protein
MEKILVDPVKSLIAVSFRAKREIFRLRLVKEIRFLPLVEMTELLSTTSYESINLNRFEYGFLRS